MQNSEAGAAEATEDESARPDSRRVQHVTADAGKEQDDVFVDACDGTNDSSVNEFVTKNFSPEAQRWMSCVRHVNTAVTRRPPSPMTTYLR